MKGGDRFLVLGAHAQPLVRGRVDARRELAHALRPRGQLVVDLDARRSGPQQFAAVVADVGDRADCDDLPGGVRAPAADAADDVVAPRDRDQQRTRRLRHVRVGGVAHDRREGTVDVEQDGGVAGV